MRCWPGRGGSRPVSGHALHELSCPRGCGKAHPVATLVTGGREAAGGAAHLSGREAAADTSMATYTGHWPSGRRSFRKQRTVNPPIAPARYNFLCSLKAACGRPPYPLAETAGCVTAVSVGTRTGGPLPQSSGRVHRDTAAACGGHHGPIGRPPRACRGHYGRPCTCCGSFDRALWKQRGLLGCAGERSAGSAAVLWGVPDSTEQSDLSQNSLPPALAVTYDLVAVH